MTHVTSMNGENKVLCKAFLLLVRDGFNRKQKYEKVFKLPNNYGIIFNKQVRFLICIKLSRFSKGDTNVERII